MTTIKPLPPCKFCGEKDVLDQSYAYCSGCMTLRPVPTSKDDRRSNPRRTQAEEALREAKKVLTHLGRTECDGAHEIPVEVSVESFKMIRAALAKIEALRSKSEAVQ